MDLGRFSVSLAVEDIAKSRTFYEALGFEVVDGKQEDNWLILQAGTTIIGLFQGMFEKNILTFNPVEGGTDVRQLQQKMKDAGIELQSEVESDDGPAHFTLLDPDGNPILVDQHH